MDGDDGEVVCIATALGCEELLGLVVNERTKDVGVGAGAKGTEGIAYLEAEADKRSEPPCCMLVSDTSLATRVPLKLQHAKYGEG